MLEKITEVYHENGGTQGYRMMRELLKARGIYLSPPTMHKYMNRILGMRSTARKRRPDYKKGEQHKKVPNIVNREFTAASRNRVRLTDFTYIALKDGSIGYSCTILDLYSREVIATRTGRRIDTLLAIGTLEDALRQAG